MNHDDSDLDHIRARIADLESDLTNEALTLEFNQAVTQLSTHPGWVSLCTRLETLVHAETNRLQGTRMDAYELGRCQGKLVVLRLATQMKPMSQQDVDLLTARVTVLREQLTEQRKLLE